MTVKLPKRREINTGLVKVADRGRLPNSPWSSLLKGPVPKMDMTAQTFPQPLASILLPFVHGNAFCKSLNLTCQAALTSIQNHRVSHFGVGDVFRKAVRKHGGCSRNTGFWLSDCLTPSSVPWPVLASLILTVILMFFTVKWHSLPFQLFNRLLQV